MKRIIVACANGVATSQAVASKVNRLLKERKVDAMVDLHLLIFAQACPLLNKLKEKTIRALKSEEQLDENLRYELLTRLDGMPKHTKLCHGDFCPSNIIVGDDGKWYLVDWVHASQGNASADVARTYLLLSLKDKKIADMYITLFCARFFTEQVHVHLSFLFVL